MFCWINSERYKFYISNQQLLFSNLNNIFQNIKWISIKVDVHKLYILGIKSFVRKKMSKRKETLSQNSLETNEWFSFGSWLLKRESGSDSVIQRKRYALFQVSSRCYASAFVKEEKTKQSVAYATEFVPLHYLFWPYSFLSLSCHACACTRILAHEEKAKGTNMFFVFSPLFNYQYWLLKEQFRYTCIMYIFEWRCVVCDEFILYVCGFVWYNIRLCVMFTPFKIIFLKDRK
jgi:hypothetical protein